jgi:predicted amidohydrolase YtcJ
VAELIQRIAAASGSDWVRAWGYEEWRLSEGRHPTREELDRAAPSRPVVLHHRSGHAAVLNSAAFDRLGEPGPDDGLLVDRHDLLASVPRLDPAGLARAAAVVSRRWADAGISAFTDATHTNDLAALETLARWRRDGVIVQEVTAMVSVDALAAVPPFGALVGEVRVGHAKIMPPADPSDGRLAERFAEARRRNWPLSVHVVDVATLDAVLHLLGPGAAGAAPDRIEHAALCVPDQIPRLAASGATVVVNPSFLLHRQDKYRAELAEAEQQWLIPLRSLAGAGVTLRAGSDAPVVPARPGEIIASACRHALNPSESLSPGAAAALLSAQEVAS